MIERDILNIINLITDDNRKSMARKLEIIKDLVNKKAYEIQTTYNYNVYHNSYLLLNDTELEEHKQYIKEGCSQLIHVKQISFNEYYRIEKEV